MRWPLTGKVVLVTGAARGIGAETARAAAARGARLALVGREPERLAELAASLGPRHAWHECDVTEQAGLDRAVAAVAGTLGGIDVVVANAGIANNGTVASNPVAALARTIEVNLVGVVRTVSATLPHVTRARGYYLLVSSAAAFTALPGMACYCAAKAGVEQFGNARGRPAPPRPHARARAGARGRAARPALRPQQRRGGGLGGRRLGADLLTTSAARAALVRWFHGPAPTRRRPAGRRGA